MARYALAAAIADEDQLVAAIVRLVGKIADIGKATLEPDLMAGPVGHHGIAHDIRERVEVRENCLLHGIPSLQQCRDALDYRRLLNGLPVTDDLDFERANDVA